MRDECWNNMDERGTSAWRRNGTRRLSQSVVASMSLGSRGVQTGWFCDEHITYGRLRDETMTSFVVIEGVWV